MDQPDTKNNQTVSSEKKQPNCYPTPYQKKMLWKAITGIAIGIIGFLLVALIWLVGNVLSFLQPVLVPLAIAGVIAYLLDPIVAWLMTKGMSRLKSVLTVFGSFVVIVGILAMIIIPPIAEQIGNKEKRQEIGENMSRTIENLGETPWIKPWVDQALAKHQPANPDGSTNDDEVELVRAKKFSNTNLAYYLSEHTGKISKVAVGFITSSATTILGTLGLLIGLAMVPIYLYYFLKESAAIKANWHDYVPLKASHFKTEVVETLREINGYLISFFRGQVLVALIDGLLVGIALWIFRLPYGVLIGLILAVIGVIPFIGNILCLIPACLIAYIHFSVPGNTVSHEWMLGTNPWAYVGAVAAIFVIVQQINSLVTAPKIVGESVGLHPMTVIFSMLFWSLILGGFLGALLAVPMTAAVKVLVRRYIWENKIQGKANIEHNANNDETEDSPEAEEPEAVAT